MMQTPTIETRRLNLRPLALSDAPAIQRHFDNWNIIKNLATLVPWPYPQDGAETFIKRELDKIASALVDLNKQIPPEIPWILRVDGHTDARPISGPVFKNNWELSTARATSVVQYLISRGVPPQRLAAAGFSQYDPIDPGNTEEAYRQNRRIELKLTER